MSEHSKIVGRESEIAVLKEALKSDQAELIAVYGRRRVGKTFLIRSVYSNQMVFDFTGVKDASLSDQLKNFNRVLVSTFKPSVKLQVAKSWIDAFWQLAELLEKDLNKGKKSFF